MILVYISIPIMVLAIAMATVPLLAAMRREERNRSRAVAFAGPFAEGGKHSDEEEVRAAA